MKVWYAIDATEQLLWVGLFMTSMAESSSLAAVFHGPTDSRPQTPSQKIAMEICLHAEALFHPRKLEKSSVHLEKSRQ